MINLTPEEEAQLERDIKMLPEISIKRMSNQQLHPDDKKVCETQKIKVQMIMFKRKLQQQQLQRKARAQNQINTAEGSRSGSKLTRAQQRRQHDSVGALPSQYGGNTPHQILGAPSEDITGDVSRDMKSEITVPGSVNSNNIAAQFNINSKILREQMLFGDKKGIN